MRGLSKVILDGTYQPSRRRLIAIAKANGQGKRTLAIRNLADRVVAAALHCALTPFWNSIFLPGSMGFRPHLGVWDTLAQLGRTTCQQDRWVLATDDLRDAFDHVNLDALMDDHRKHLPDAKLLHLIEVVLRGSEHSERKEGQA